jgi:Cys-tRNA(Pro) deacylase
MTVRKGKIPVTAAIRVLRQHHAVFTEHLYDYEDRGGAWQGAQSLGIEVHRVVKTLVMEDERKRPLIVLMHGDKQVSAKELARLLNVKSISPCDPQTATKHTSYQVGGVSPFGTRRMLPTYMEASIMDLNYVYINGGKRGFLVGMSPDQLCRLLHITLVQVAVANR